LASLIFSAMERPEYMLMSIFFIAYIDPLSNVISTFTHYFVYDPKCARTQF
jgi:hypothetical protein